MAKKRTRSGRITLRTTPEIHEQLAEVGRMIHLDVNGILNLMLHRYLGPLAAEVAVFDHYRQRAGRLEIDMFNEWEEKNPGKKPREFLNEFRKFILGEPNSLEPPGQLSDGVA
jgi:hypothetical protein